MIRALVFCGRILWSAYYPSTDYQALAIIFQRAGSSDPDVPGGPIGDGWHASRSHIQYYVGVRAPARPVATRLGRVALRRALPYTPRERVLRDSSIVRAAAVIAVLAAARLEVAARLLGRAVAACRGRLLRTRWQIIVREELLH